jgi:hypothetical protein
VQSVSAWSWGFLLTFVELKFFSRHRKKEQRRMRKTLSSQEDAFCFDLGNAEQTEEFEVSEEESESCSDPEGRGADFCFPDLAGLSIEEPDESESEEEFESEDGSGVGNSEAYGG